MWAVLGLVSTDVMSVLVSGLVDGQHVGETMTIAVDARDNRDSKTAGVRKVEIFVDDLPVEGACAAKVAWSWKTAGLSEGKHVVDVVATNTRGEDSRRRFEVFAGNIFLTEVGARFDETRQITEISARNIAPTAEAAGKVELTVWSVEGADNTAQGARVREGAEGRAGATAWNWDGRGSDGKSRPRGRYVAELVMRDARGKTIQKASTLFFHDSETEQRRRFAKIEGNLAMRGGAGSPQTRRSSWSTRMAGWSRRCVRPRRGTIDSRASRRVATVCAREGGLGSGEAAVEAAPAAAPAKANMDSKPVAGREGRAPRGAQGEMSTGKLGPVSTATPSAARPLRRAL